MPSPAYGLLLVLFLCCSAVTGPVAVTERLDPTSGTVLDLVAAEAAPPNATVVVRVAPATALGEPDDVEAIRTRSTSLPAGGPVAPNDTLVLELHARGLAEAVAAANGTNTTERFFSLVNGSDAHFRVQQSNAPASLPPAYLVVTDSRATTVVGDPQSDTYYLVVDLGTVRTTDNYPGTPARRIRPGDEFAVEFGLGDARRSARRHTDAEFTVVERTSGPATILTITTRWSDRRTGSPSDRSPTVTDVNGSTPVPSGQPGLGPLAGSLALLTGAMIAARRRR